MSLLRVALTIDAEHPDRPTQDGVADSIVETLTDHAIRATFFMQGRWVEAYPAQAANIARAGHVIGNHSFYHARMPLLSDKGFVADVTAAARVIARVCGTDGRPWFRCPFGAGEDDPRTHRLLGDVGYRHVGWDVEGDWLVGMSGPRLVRDTIAGVRARGDGAIVLFHSWPRSTARALPAIIDGLEAHGARFVGVDELGRG